MLDDTTMLIPGAKYMIDAESAADQNLIQPLKDGFGTISVKPEILTPANAGYLLFTFTN